MSALEFNTTIRYRRLQSSPDEVFAGCFNGVDLTYELIDGNLTILERGKVVKVLDRVTKVLCGPIVVQEA
jgi:acyl CoA:acetate/3-ketoacid CoA transferase